MGTSCIYQSGSMVNTQLKRVRNKAQRNIPLTTEKCNQYIKSVLVLSYSCNTMLKADSTKGDSNCK